MQRKEHFEKFHYLFNQFIEKNCSEQERADFLEMVSSNVYMPLLRELIKKQVENPKVEYEMTNQAADKVFGKIMELVGEVNSVEIKSSKNIFLYWRYIAAALVIILAGSLFWFLKMDKPVSKSQLGQIIKPIENDVLPGKTGAILTLANGETIVLDSADNGLLAEQGRTKITKQNGQLKYSAEGNFENNEFLNTMTTPKGRKYQLVLSDGSKVWLNAASSITYPVAFTGDERKVLITGEVFFNISTVQMAAGTGKEKMPFVVEVLNSAGEKERIKVLGTQFNVGAYPDESTIKTTLVEGMVQVFHKENSVIIDPGQAALLQSGVNKITVGKADVEEAIAWKEGFFNFRNADIETIMRQVARWYDVEIVYNKEIPKGNYRGEISRDVNASEMLKVLEISGIRFNIEGRKIIVL